MTISDARYPVGKFQPPFPILRDDILTFTSTIIELPRILRLALSNVGDSVLNTPYREGGWTVRQVVHHLADSHINSFMRFKLALTEDSPTIKPYFESLWAEMEDAKILPIESSLKILEGIHYRWAHLLSTMSPDDFSRVFVHPEHGKTFRLDTTLALYAWHSRHHFGHIESVVKSGYVLE